MKFSGMESQSRKECFSIKGQGLELRAEDSFIHNQAVPALDISLLVPLYLMNLQNKVHDTIPHSVLKIPLK